MWLLNPYRFGTAYDTDAAAYIAAVEAADGQTLETGVKDAINAFVIGCKADGIWTAIKASCILAGARTLAGALVPLVGTAPTNFNFVAGDYNRKTGLVGNGSNKYLNSNRANNADPRDNKHASVFVSTGDSGTSGNPYYFSGGTNGFVGLLRVVTGNALAGYLSASTSAIIVNNQGDTIGFKGVSRGSSSSITMRTSNNSTSRSQASFAETAASNIVIFADNLANTLANYTNARLAFYSIGESLNLALLDTRVTTLVNAIAAAIP